MELVSIEQSRLISLFETTRPIGQLYLPDAIVALVGRYSFVEVPTKLVGVETFEFKHGKFGNSAIETFAVFNDGVVISARSNTKILEEFYDDVQKWSTETFGITRIEAHNVSKMFESSVVISATADLLRLVRNSAAISKLVASKLESINRLKLQFEPVGIQLGPDITRIPSGDMKPTLFRVERRANTPFSRNLFFSTAPLTTDDHLEVLTALESLVSA